MTDAANHGSFHAGERAMQARTGMDERMREIGPRVIRDFMPDQHRELFEELPLVLVGSLDAQGRPWASMITGTPGFVSTPDARSMRIHGPLHAEDPLRARLHVGSALGVLGIQLETRRRNRMNGRVRALNDDLLELQVEQSFGNCPKYIHQRKGTFRAGPRSVDWSQARRESHRLSPEALQLVENADTFFIASASTDDPSGSAAQGVDISHRGGAAGFVEARPLIGEPATGPTVLTAPDYVGNFFFNTLGNLSVYPYAGLLFPNFVSGDLLSLTVEAELVFDGAELALFQGAQRLTRFHVREGFLVPSALPLRFSERGL